MSLSIQLDRRNNVLIVRLYGELDHHTSERVRTAIENEWKKGIYSNLILNLKGLDFMDSSGLGVILGRYKRVSQLGGKMILCAVQPSIQKIMEMSGLFKILPAFADEKRAISACEVAS